jgi:hypothetical protein
MPPATSVPVTLAGADWDAEEVREIRSIAAEIESCAARRRRAANKVIHLSLSDSLRFSQGMRSTFRALIVRQLLEKFGFDEHRVFRWRLEHKLTQALLLNHYAPGSVPATRGLHRFASKV